MDSHIAKIARRQLGMEAIDTIKRRDGDVLNGCRILRWGRGGD